MQYKRLLSIHFWTEKENKADEQRSVTPLHGCQTTQVTRHTIVIKPGLCHFCVCQVIMHSHMNRPTVYFKALTHAEARYPVEICVGR